MKKLIGLNIVLVLALAFTVNNEASAKTKRKKRTSIKRSTSSVSKNNKFKRPPMKGSGPIPKKVWFKWMKQDLSQEMCRDDSYLRTCFKMKKKSCVQAMKSEMNNCWSKQSIRWRQRKVKPRQEGVIMGRNLGQCTGVRIEKKFKKRKVKSDQCRYMGRWMGR